MEVYLKLLGCAMIPVAFSLLFFILQNRTGFGQLSQKTQQVIIGICFGAAAVFGTEFGVSLGNATINARDAAPLCAGLLFGAPAGIIAGIIGGVERWCAAYWGAGMYSQVACSVATVVAGLYAGLLRKNMFDDKRPTVLMSFAVGVVMEALHLACLLLTHLSDSAKAFTILKACTLPMILVNAFAVGLAVFAISLFSKEKLEAGKVRSIAQKVQSAMLLCIVVAFVGSSAFVYSLQTNNANLEAERLMDLNILDIETEVRDKSDTTLLSLTRSIGVELDSGSTLSLDELKDKYNVSEISLVNNEGIIIDSTEPSFIGFDMQSGEQSREFMVLLEKKTSTYVQAYGPIAKDSTQYRKYAGAKLFTGGFVQVGYDSGLFLSDIKIQVRGITANRHLGENGFVIITEGSGKIVSDLKDHSETNLDSVGISLEGVEPGVRMRSLVYGVDSYWSYEEAEGLFVIAVVPVDQILSARDNYIVVNSYMEIIVFAVLYGLIYTLIKKLVVNNIRVINKDLRKIVDDNNLSVTVDVRSSEEFSSLSDDINSTVTTMNQLIEAAKAKNAAELEMAKNIQTSALPVVGPIFASTKEIDINAFMETAKEVGGDFYDAYKLGSDKVAFLIADVSGKGIPAAMFMMRAKTMIKNMAEEGHPVNEIFTLANDKLCEGNDAGMFVTAWMGILELSTGHVTYANAGHNPPVLMRKGGDFEYLQCRAGLVLSAMEGMHYRMGEFDMYPGDRIYLYTDGVTEATDTHDQLYGEDRLLVCLNGMKDATVEELLPGVKASIDEFVGEAEQFDDITMVTLTYNGTN